MRRQNVLPNFKARHRPGTDSRITGGSTSALRHVANGLSGRKEQRR